MKSLDENYVRSAYAHALETDKAISENIERLEKMTDPFGIMKAVAVLFKILGSESKLIVDCLEKTSYIKQIKRT